MGSILINPWLPGQRASPQMKWWCLCCQFPQVTTQSTQRGPALFEPDVGKQASPTVSLSPTPPTTSLPLHSSPSLLLGRHMPLMPELRCSSGRIAAVLHRLPSSSLQQSLSLSFSLWDRSIHPFTSPPPFPLFSPLPPRLAHCPFPLRSGGKSAVCVLPGSVPALIIPLLFSYLILPSSLSFPPLIPCFPPLPYPLFLLSATSPPSFSSYLPLSPSLSPPASNHSPSISFTLCLHSYFILRLSLPPPPSPPPSLPPHLPP